MLRDTAEALLAALWLGLFGVARLVLWIVLLPITVPAWLIARLWRGHPAIDYWTHQALGLPGDIWHWLTAGGSGD